MTQLARNRSREWKIERLPPTPGGVIVTPRGLLDATTGRVKEGGKP